MKRIAYCDLNLTTPTGTRLPLVGNIPRVSPLNNLTYKQHSLTMYGLVVIHMVLRTNKKFQFKTVFVALYS